MQGSGDGKGQLFMHPLPTNTKVGVQRKQKQKNTIAYHFLSEKINVVVMKKVIGKRTSNLLDSIAKLNHL